jgi:UDP-N-acetylmuramoylalanine--D-glutamate ligase
MKIIDLKSKKIAIFGFGREGRSILSAIEQRLENPNITILNDTPLENINYPTCIAKDINLTDYDIIIKSPGISLYRSEFTKIKPKITSSTNLWLAEYSNIQTICITGTKGKSTTSSLIVHLLKSVGLRVALGGNIGKPLFEINIKNIDILVIELSSYQTSDLSFLPDKNISVLLNLFPEHLDWHKNTENYFKDKLNLLKNPHNLKIINYTDNELKKYVKNLDNIQYFNYKNDLLFSENDLSEFSLLGEHNLENLAATLTVIKSLNIKIKNLKNTLKDFKGLEHRLYYLGEKNGITYIDDSISTTPQSTIAAIKTFPHKKITLILGGYNRGLNWQELAKFLLNYPIEKIITMGASGKIIFQEIKNNIHENSSTKYYMAKNLHDAVEIAKKITPLQGLILLSPASPSYGDFNNFQERGNEFKKIMNN